MCECFTQKGYNLVKFIPGYTENCWPSVKISGVCWQFYIHQGMRFTKMQNVHMHSHTLLIKCFFQPTCFAFDWQNHKFPTCVLHTRTTQNDTKSTPGTLHVKVGPCLKSKYVIFQLGLRIGIKIRVKFPIFTMQRYRQSHLHPLCFYRRIHPCTFGSVH